MPGSLQLISLMTTITLVVVGLLLFAWRSARRSGQRLRAKVQRLQQDESRLIQTEKMATVGQVAAGVAHEINNPVGFIMSNLFTLQEYFDFQNRLQAVLLELARTEPDNQVARRELRQRLEELLQQDDPEFIREDGFKLINESLEGATRVKEIVLNLMAMARADGPVVHEVDLNESLRSVSAILEARPGFKDRLSLDLQPLPAVRGRATELNQALLHLLENALEHTPPGTPVAVISDMQDGQIRIRISDHGPGIPAEDRERVFNPFFTTKNAGQGAGLGLSLARDILGRHQGSLELMDCPHPGACFRILLPAASASGPREKPAPHQEEPVFQVQDGII